MRLLSCVDCIVHNALILLKQSHHIGIIQQQSNAANWGERPSQGQIPAAHSLLPFLAPAVSAILWKYFLTRPQSQSKIHVVFFCNNYEQLSPNQRILPLLLAPQNRKEGKKRGRATPRSPSSPSGPMPARRPSARPYPPGRPFQRPHPRYPSPPHLYPGTGLQSPGAGHGPSR